jgi:hypothetical protein
MPRTPRILITAAALVAVTAAAYAWQNAPSQQPEAKAPQPPADAQQRQQLPDLVTALKETPGCLGVELARTMGGKQVIFSWFEDKNALLKWYYSEIHQQSMDIFFQERGGEDYKPLESIPDDAGPLLVITSITMADKPKFKETTLPISQIAIEIYEPVSGGLYLGGRFAPDKVYVENMQDYTPKAEDDTPHEPKAQD